MRKANLLALACSCLLLRAGLAQNTYYVLHIKGEVIFEKTKVLLKVNDYISDKETLLFGTPSDAVAVIGSENDRMILRPAKATQLSCVVKDILSPGIGRLSTQRAGGTIELRHYFEPDSLHLFGQTRVWISPWVYSLDSTDYFFVRYTWKGEVIKKRLALERDSLVLSPDIYKVGGTRVGLKEIKRAQLFLSQGRTLTEVGSFTAMFPDESLTKNIAGAYKKHSTLKGKDFSDEVNSLLTDIYGRTDPANVRAWLRRILGKF